MGHKFTKISQDTFDELQLDAGVLLSAFDPDDPATPDDEDIICATTGGINVICRPNYSDFGEDVDNVPNNMMEFKHLDYWDCSMAFTSIKFSAAALKLGVGAFDVDAESGAIKPRRDLAQTDFKDIWWVGDKTDGGAVAVRLKNGLSTEGVNIQTSKNGKGTMALTIVGHMSIDNQDEIPMEFYVLEGDDTVVSVKQILSHVTSTNEAKTVTKTSAYSTTLAAKTDYTIESVVVLMGGEDVTDDAWTSGTGVVSIASVTGDIVIIATAVAD